MENLPKITILDLEIVRLTSDHQPKCNLFSCEEPDLCEFIQRKAIPESDDCFSTTHLLLWNGQIVGYFSLVTTTVKKKSATGLFSLFYPYDKQIPAIKIARLARDINYKGYGIGDIIMQKIFSLLYQLNQSIGFRILVVNAKENAITYYSRYSFKEAYKNGGEATMYLDTKELITEIDRIKGKDKEI